MYIQLFLTVSAISSKAEGYEFEHTIQAEAHLNALTSPPGRGKRQIEDDTELVEAAQAILKQPASEGLLAIIPFADP